MNVNIYPIPLGIDYCYLICGKECIMIDGGTPRKASAFIKIIKKLPANPKDIQLIVLTHGHWDHIGSARDIKELTGAKIVIHKNEKDLLEKSLKPLPPGVTTWGRLFKKIMAMFMPLIHIPAAEVDMVLDDHEFSLGEYGIPGKVIHTPGHSSGSVSILLETGEAFVGDLAMNTFPLRMKPGLPIFAEDIHQVKESWKEILKRGAKVIYPAHGKPFSADIIRKTL